METDSGPIALGGQTTIGLPARRVLFDEPTPQIPDYRLIKPVGRGAFGTVWLAEEPLIGAFRAVKVLAGRNGASAHAERELEGVRAYQTRVKEHPHLVRVFKTGLCRILPLPSGEGRGEGSCESRTFVYYVMEIADYAGGAQPHRPEDYQPLTLASLIRRKGRLPVDVVVKHAGELLEAIEHLHAAGIHHRDIKPSNCLFVGGELKLADIGLVSDDNRELIGTSGYLPPDGKPDDLYALGKVMYEMLTGLPASAFPEWPGDLGVGAAQANCLWKSYTHLRVLINTLCHPDAALRLSKPQELRRGIASCIERPGHAISMRRQVLSMGGTALAVALIAAWCVVWWHNRNDPTKQRSAASPYDGSVMAETMQFGGTMYHLGRAYRPDDYPEVPGLQTKTRMFDIQTRFYKDRFEICGGFQMYNVDNPVAGGITDDRGEIDQLWLVFGEGPTARMELLYYGQPGAEPGVTGRFGLRGERGALLSELPWDSSDQCNIYFARTIATSIEQAKHRYLSKLDFPDRARIATVSKPVS